MDVNEPLVLSLVELAGSPVLAGVPEGQGLFSRIVQATASQPPAAIVLLDFSGVRIATASFLRESVAAFRKYARHRASGAYPVLSNVPPPVLDELRLLGEVWPVCETEAGQVVRSRIEGNLDPKQRSAFELVDRHGPIDVRGLSELDQSDDVQLPAWHNRVRALVERGLVIERSSDRGKLLESILKAVT